MICFVCVFFFFFFGNSQMSVHVKSTRLLIDHTPFNLYSKTNAVEIIVLITSEIMYSECDMRIIVTNWYTLLLFKYEIYSRIADSITVLSSIASDRNDLWNTIRIEQTSFLFFFFLGFHFTFCIASNHSREKQYFSFLFLSVCALRALQHTNVDHSLT